ncbi:hypothetical protein CBM2613_A50071 [Cupriavidus taiwanensis]|uniref:Uncharacterized protein n=1 Tax=Cupriavidus taiwanensis TaxID=164546 RepID=A0A976G2X2_9BURK|nr:hypothetical protein CBM2613_A50071 [Cupriavidus taiwanensis]
MPIRLGIWRMARFRTGIGRPECGRFPCALALRSHRQISIIAPAARRRKLRRRAVHTFYPDLASPWGGIKPASDAGRRAPWRIERRSP